MPLQRVPGFCALCRSRCGCISVVDDGRLVAVEPDPLHPTGSAICVKGRAAPELVNSPERLLAPIRRTRPKGDPDPGWEEISWDDALDWTAAQVRRVRDNLGPESVAFAATSPSGTAISDAITWVERLVRAFGSPNMVYSTEICNWHKDFASAYTFGVGIPAPDFVNAGCILLWGHNPPNTWLAHATLVREGRRRGAKLVVVDPRRAGFARQADEWLRVRPGTDGALALGLAGIMIENSWYDTAFVRDWTTGPFLVREDTGRFLTPADLPAGGSPRGRVAYDRSDPSFVSYEVDTGLYEAPVGDCALRASVTCPTRQGAVRCHTAFELYASLCSSYSPERTEQLTGVPSDQLMRVARMLYQHRPVAYYAWSGVGQHTNATQTDRAISLLYSLTGSFDAPGGNVVYSRPHVKDISGLSLLPDSQAAKSIDLLRRPLGPGRHGWMASRELCRAILEEDPYPVRGLVAFGTNLLLSQPDTARVLQALERLEFFVHCDLFLTPTSELADVVLPVSSAWEREGLRVGFEVTQEAEELIQLRAPVVEPRGKSRSDIEIVFGLAKRLGLDDSFFGGDIDAGYRFLLAPSGVTVEALRARPEGVRVPMTTRYRKYRERSDGSFVGFATPSRRVEIYQQEFLEHGQDPLPRYVEPSVSHARQPGLAQRYPLTLTTAKKLHFCHSQHRTLPRLRRANPEPTVEIHPSLAEAQRIEAGDWVVVESPVGAMRARVRVSDALAPDVVCAEFGWWQACKALGLPGYEVLGTNSANYNALIGDDAVDPISGSTPLRSYLCRIRKDRPPALDSTSA